MIDEPMARIVGTIHGETTKKWWDWDHGEPFAVAFCRGLCFCLPGGTVIVS